MFTKPDLAANTIALASAIFSAAGVLGAYMSVREVRRDRNEKSQPSLVVEFPMRSSGVIDFVIRNTSPNLARNVTVSFDNPPRAIQGEYISEWPLLQNPIDIPPRSKEMNFFHVSSQFLNDVNAQKIFTVTINCETENRETCEPRVFKFDFNSRMDQILPPKTVDDYAKDISEELRRITNEIGRTERLLGHVITGDAWLVTEEKSSYDKRKRDEIVEQQAENNQ